MITKEEFITLINNLQDYDKKISELFDSKIISDDFVFDLTDVIWKIFYSILLINFTEEGEDWIEWWVIERKDGCEAWDEDDNKIPMETIDDLWEYVKQYRK